MSESNNSSLKSLLTASAPRFPAPLDPACRPAICVWLAYAEQVGRTQEAEPISLALEDADGRISRWDAMVLPPGNAEEATRHIVERAAKFLLWSRGGCTLHAGGDRKWGEMLQTLYAPDGPRAFDAELMERIFERPFKVRACTPDEVPAAAESATRVGGHLDGCRIGFDLGASDYKLAAVRDGEPVFSTEIPWQPQTQSDPAYHFEKISEGLRLAASHLPRVDAIGGSSAGVYVNNRPMVASLFRAVPQDRFSAEVQPMFERLGREWGVPLVVINDGDVTALAGAMSLSKPSMFGMAMGSSEAVGYLNMRGSITGWLNELAFAPVDLNPDAAADEWSGDRGVGALHFSQQAVNRLAPAAGFSFPEDMGLPERLKQVQENADAGDPAAARIFQTIGVYLGYSLPWYRLFYEYDDVLVLGRVTSGRGGEIILDTARDVLSREFPDVAAGVSIHVPDEESRRVGQAVAAASLPALRSDGA